MKQLKASEIKVGHCYRAKKPKVVGFMQYLDDRQVKWIGISQVQYDSPTVKDGRRYPIISMEKFLKWAGWDCTNVMPEGDWQPRHSIVR